MDMLMSAREQIVGTIAEYAKIPSIEKATILSVEGNLAHLACEFTIRHYAGDNCEKQRYEAIHSIDLVQQQSACVAVNRISGTLKVKSLSPSRKYSIQCYEDGLIEVVYPERIPLLPRSFQGMALCCVPSPHPRSMDNSATTVRLLCERPVCYQAERSGPPSEPTILDTVEYRQAWGEKLATRIDPAIFVLDIASGQIKELPTPKTICPASPCLLEGGDVVFIGYAVQPIKHGLFYIYNRSAQIYRWRDAKNDFQVLFDDARVAPRSLQSARGRLFFLTSVVGGSHFASSKLNSINIDGSGHAVLAEGLFTRWIENIAGQVAINAFHRSSNETLVWDFDASTFRREMGVCILDSLYGVSVHLTSSPSKAPSLLIKAGEALGHGLALHRRGLPTHLASLEHKVHRLDDYSDCITVTPPNPNGRLVIIPHGGPNSVSLVEYSLNTALLTHYGFTVVLVNYTGSVGFAPEGIAKLEGTIGVQDVADVMRALEAVKATHQVSDKVFLMGGSHGGYICAFLCGLYPERFAGCILRNPVVDLSAMVYASDIDDWAFGQMGLPYDLKHPRPASEEESRVLQRHSPSSLVQNVKTPTLVMVGEKDLRVPPFQGRRWHQWLVANGVQSRLLVFPDANHALDTATSEKLGLIAILEFLRDSGSMNN